MVSVRGQSTKDRLLHLRRLPQVAVLHGALPPACPLALLRTRVTAARATLSRLVWCAQKEFGIAQASNKLLVVACEPLSKIRAVDPSAYPQASNALAYLMGGGQVIFHADDDVVAEIRKFLA